MDRYSHGQKCGVDSLLSGSDFSSFDFTSFNGDLPLPGQIVRRGSSLDSCSPSHTESFRTPDREVIQSILHRSSSTETTQLSGSALAKKNKQAEKLLKRLQRLETSTDMEMVKKRIEDGHFFHRGFDRDNRPVIWMKTFRGLRGLQKRRFGEYFLPFVWVVLWTLAQRPGRIKAIRYIMIDDESRLSLDFNMEFISSFGELLRRLGACLPVVGPFTIYSSRSGLKVLVKTIQARAPNWRKQIWLEKRVFSARHFMRDLSDIPAQGIFRAGQIHCAVSASDVGDVANLIRGRCFQNMTVSLFTFPCKSKYPWAELTRSLQENHNTPPNQQLEKTTRVEIAQRQWNHRVTLSSPLADSMSTMQYDGLVSFSSRSFASDTSARKLDFLTSISEERLNSSDGLER